MLLTAIVLSTLLAAPLALWAVRSGRAALMTAWPASIFIALASLLPEVTAGGERIEQTRWIASLGIELAFRADSLALLFGLLISGIGTANFRATALAGGRVSEAGRHLGISRTTLWKLRKKQ